MAVASELRIDRNTLPAAVEMLQRADPDLKRIVEQYGPPPLWSKSPGFASLVHIILSQQVSVDSAEAAYRRLRESLGRVTPTRFLTLNDKQLLAIGFSRQKTGYCRGLAEALCSGQLKLTHLRGASADEVETTLMSVKGVGPWTVRIFQLMALGHPDIWPVGDIALAQAAADIKGLTSRPDDKQLLKLAESWRPWRSVAARMLWHFYLKERAKRRRT